MQPMALGTKNNDSAQAAVVPKTLWEALNQDDPEQALLALSIASRQSAERISMELQESLSTKDKPGLVLPDSIKDVSNEMAARPSQQSHPVITSIACAESILSSLSKIASGGTKASEEMRQLEGERSEMDSEANDVAVALKLRQCASVAAEALSAQRYEPAATAIRDYARAHATPRALKLAGDYTVQRYDQTRAVLTKALLDRYGHAVNTGDLKALGTLTPLLSLMGFEKKGVGLYLQFSKAAIEKVLDQHENKGMTDEEINQQSDRPANMPISRAERRRAEARLASKPPYSRMATVYNIAVTHLRHHLPMVSHALGKADGDAALIQLVHLQVEQKVLPVFEQYIRERKLQSMAQNSQRIYSILEERYVTIGMDAVMESTHASDGSSRPLPTEWEQDDGGFAAEIGVLASVDGLMDEAALCLQHTEAYVRFLRHAMDEVNRARELRFSKEVEEERVRKQMEEVNNPSKSSEHKEEPAPSFKPVEILPAHTQLNEVAAEVGGYYSGIERCLLLASMQRAFGNGSRGTMDDISPLSIVPPNLSHGSPGSEAFQTSVVEECMYATRRSSLRAFATGHSGTASAAANFASDCLGRVLLEVLSRRVEAGVSELKPGSGLLEGTSGLLGHAAGLIRGAATTATRHGMTVPTRAVGVTTPGGGGNVEEDATRIRQGIARACAMINDIEVAVNYTQRLATKLSQEIDSGYPAGKETEQLRTCVKGLSQVIKMFKQASERTIELLASTIAPRVRSLVSDAVGLDTAGSATFIMSGAKGKSADRSAVRMNYELDDAGFELAQASEGYVSRLCSSLDDLLDPLRIHLAPSLSDELVIAVIGSALKRIEAAIRRCRFTENGAYMLDSDVRYLLQYTKSRIVSAELSSHMALYRGCTPLARLSQIAALMNLEDLDGVLDLISENKRKGTWDLKLEDAKLFLNLRVDFEGRKVNELLRLSDDE